MSVLKNEVKMELTKSQKIMEQDGLPAACFKTVEERKKIWEENPPKPLPAFNIPATATDQEALKLLSEIEFQKKTKTKNRIHKMLDKKEDKTGKRWDPRTSRFVDETALLAQKRELAMISITTNTRGSTKMAKDYAEMSLTELAEAYNKISGKEPIKKFKDKATGLKRMAELQTAKAAAKAAAPKSDTVRKPKAAPKEGSENKRAAEFGCRVGSFREKLIIALDEHFEKMVSTDDLLKAVYGSKNNENTGALTMVLKGAQAMIEKNKLPYILKKEKDDAGKISHGLFPK